MKYTRRNAQVVEVDRSTAKYAYVQRLSDLHTILFLAQKRVSDLIDEGLGRDIEWATVSYYGQIIDDLKAELLKL